MWKLTLGYGTWILMGTNGKNKIRFNLNLKMWWNNMEYKHT